MSDPHRFIPYPLKWDSMPIDLSFLYQSEKPAGRHGFVAARDDRLVFQDGTDARFWGTNFNSGANFPDFDYSEKVAARLARTGINLVRFHQLDSEWATPNIFQFSKGRRAGATGSLDPESMKRLDYLVSCLKSQGIYLYLDMMTYRKFKTGDGVPAALSLADAARPYCIFDPHLIELQKAFNEALWEHVNPYTGAAYKDEPAIVLTEIINEGDMFRKDRPVTVEPYRWALLERYRQWRESRGMPPSAGTVDFSDWNETMLAFLSDVQMTYYRDMAAHLRGIGVRIPIAGTNWSINGANRLTQTLLDFADGHTYWYDWTWGEQKKRFHNRSMMDHVDSVFPELSFSRLLDKPFFVSEWDDPWPKEWRAESSLVMAAVGSFQGWSGLAIHTYRYDTSRDIDVVGKEIAHAAIGSVPYREGVFCTFNDPAKYGLFYHAALLFRRADVKKAEKTIAVRLGDLSLTPQTTPALAGVTEMHRVGLVFGDGEPAGAQMVGPDAQLDLQEEIVSDTGELRRSMSLRMGSIDTVRTKAAYGFLGGAGTVALKGLTIRCRTDFAVIALSSLTDAPIAGSDNLLLTTVGRSENTAMLFNEDHTELLDYGRAPVLVEVIEAEMEIVSERDNLRVWSVGPEGFFTGVIPSAYEKGALRFALGRQFPSMYYLIQAE